MKFKSVYHGEIKYSENQVITFKKGIPGFQELRQFVLVDLKENPMFKLLHSLEDEKLGFIVISPFLIKEDYEIELPNELVKSLNIEKKEEVIVYNTITLHTDYNKITTNLRAPFIININNGLGEQLILNNEKYKIKYPLVKE